MTPVQVFSCQIFEILRTPASEKSFLDEIKSTSHVFYLSFLLVQYEKVADITFSGHTLDT